VPKQVIKASLTLSDDDEAELSRILGCKPAKLSDALAPYASAALIEYVMMFLGQKVFTRGSDIREYRLLLLIQNVLDNHIPDEARVSRLFQSTTSESRALLRAVMSKYQSQSYRAAAESIKEILLNAKGDGQGPWLITVDNTIIVERLNRALAESDGTLGKVERHNNSVSTYEVTPASFNALCDTFKSTPPARGKGATP
jgi:hypothetical protein